jgi:cyanophycinase-like exopeptidase
MAKTKAMNEFSDMGMGFDALKGLFVDQAAKNTENLGMLNKFIGNNPVYGAGMTIL